MALVVLVAIVAVGLAAFALQYQARQARARAAAALAQRVGFTFAAADTAGIPDLPFPFFRLGRGRKAQLVLTGTHNQLPLQLFDYQYYVDTGRSREYHRFTCALLTIPAACPLLRLSHENVLTKLEDHLTHHDVKLEYDDFNQRFLVQCEDQKFAFALLDGEMMQWLLAADGFQRVEIVGPWILLVRQRLAPASWLDLGTWLDAFHAHIPPIVYSSFPRT